MRATTRHLGWLTLIMVVALATPAMAGTPSGDETVATESTCTAQAYCEEGGYWISCTGSTTCIAVDQDCENSQRGYVECDAYWEDQCPPCPVDCTGFPYMTKCIDGLTCKPGCHSCGDGTCWHGTCNCLI
jgi:hypothetical protein